MYKLLKVNDVVDGNDTDNLSGFFCFGYRQCGDIVGIHHCESIGQERILGNMFVGRCHDLCSCDMHIVVFLYCTADIAVGDNTDTVGG